MKPYHKPIKVTSPLLPPVSRMQKRLEEIWQSGWLTNDGRQHRDLENAIAEYLNSPNANLYVSLFANGTLPLMAAFAALRLGIYGNMKWDALTENPDIEPRLTREERENKTEVITTPYTFAATAHSILWAGLKPVFVDVDPIYGNILPGEIEKALSPRTAAILPVHVYGNPCPTDEIEAIAHEHGLPVIYDAAHAFGVKRLGKSILEAGHMSTLSFHATKTFTTAEGGALITHNAEMKQKADWLKNFGFENEEQIMLPGINAKMDEIRAALGLENLLMVDNARQKRRQATLHYRRELSGIKGLRFIDDMPGIEHNYGYFPVFIDENSFGLSRNQLYRHLKANKILARRYFYPIVTDLAPYKGRYGGGALPNATKLASEVICLPMHHLLEPDDIDFIVKTIKNARS